MKARAKRRRVLETSRKARTSARSWFHSCKGQLPYTKVDDVMMSSDPCLLRLHRERCGERQGALSSKCYEGWHAAASLLPVLEISPELSVTTSSKADIYSDLRHLPECNSVRSCCCSYTLSPLLLQILQIAKLNLTYRLAVHNPH